MTVSDRPIILVGAGMHGRVVRDVCRDAGLDVAGYLDDFAAVGQDIDGCAVVGPTSALADPDFLARHRFLVTIGNNGARQKFARMIEAAGGEVTVVAHPNAVVSPSASIGAGTVLVGGNMVFSRARIGKNVLVDPDVTIGAESVIGDGVYLCPGVHLGAGVTIAENAFVGLGAVILPELDIGPAAVIAAGAVVTRDVPGGMLAAGNPAIIKGAVVLDDFSPYPARARNRA